jgi:hypothetical protein
VNDRWLEHILSELTRVKDSIKTLEQNVDEKLDNLIVSNAELRTKVGLFSASIGVLAGLLSVVVSDLLISIAHKLF